MVYKEWLFALLRRRFPITGKHNDGGTFSLFLKAEKLFSMRPDCQFKPDFIDGLLQAW